MCVWLVYRGVILRGIKRFDLVVQSLGIWDAVLLVMGLMRRMKDGA
jgi:hypothetical protein